MNLTTVLPVPTLETLSKALPMDGSIAIDFAEGIPVLRASAVIQQRIEELLLLQRQKNLGRNESAELDAYEEMDDYLSFLNRVIRNLHETAHREN